MNEYDTPNYTEYTYEKHAEGKLKLAKHLLVVGYVAFVIGFFILCSQTAIQLFAVCPIFTWMLVFFTWRYVSFDIYYTFNHGDMDFGKLKVKKNRQVRRSVVKLNVKSALLASPYAEAVSTDEYRLAKKIYDFSSKSTSKTRIAIVYTTAKGNCAVVFESTPKAASLIASFCPNAKNLKAR